MKTVVASTFRDATPYLGRYLDQAYALRRALDERGDSLEFVWGEGDSIDDTAAELRLRDVGAVVDVSTGHRYCPSTEDTAARWANVARFCNATLDAVPACDVLLWAEADLIWTADTAVALIDQAAFLGAVVAAPVWHHDGFFYDTWSVRLDGEKYIPPREGGLVHVDSASGLLAVPAPLIGHRFPDDEACRGWTRQMGGVWLDTDRQAVQP